MVQQAGSEELSDPTDIEFRELLRRLPVAAYTTDVDGLITWFNAPAVEVWGRAPRLHDAADRFCGSFRLFHADGTPMAHEDCWMGLALRNRSSYNGQEVVIEREDGTRRTALAYANPIFDDGRLVGAVNVLMDITDRKRAEVELREANEAKNSFLAVLAHELRNPLAPMRTAVELLQRAEDGPTRARAERTLDRQVTHLTRIVEDLVDVARITRGTLELRRTRTELGPILEHAADSARALTDARSQRLELHLPEEPITVDADPVRLAQLVGNLLANASKYSDPGQPVTLRAERMGSDIVISVLDEGIGIDAHDVPSIFDLFARGDAATQEGLGVGLTLARELAEMHGGFIEVRSAGRGRGSEFRVHLPATGDFAPLAPLAPASEPAALGTPGGRRVLVVDDNRDAAEALAEILMLDGCDARIAHDGATAVEVAASWRPDAVLLDIGLPRLNGYEAARRIRQLPGGQGIRLIAVTGWGQPDDRARSAAAGFDHHVVKPIDLATLTTLLEPVA